MKITYIFLIVIFILVTSCKDQESKPLANLEVNQPTFEASYQEPQKPRPLSEDFKNYWYNGTAEITSYELNQGRYGEIRKGSAILIYVTEDFLPDAQVKADQQSERNIPILKLNATKNFNTGIYPYSIMESTFYPVGNHQHAIKVASSMQEWCGQIYAQLNNRDQFEITSHSYFQGEEDEKFALEKNLMENELWTQIRIDPSTLPKGDITIIPGLAYAKMKHLKLQAYKANATLEETADNMTYTLNYPELKRTLVITFENKAPYTISSWKETYISRGKQLTSTGTRKKQIRSAYWGKNSNADEELRKELGL